jgi:multiple sugar transport system substrate-binding protein
MAFVLLVSLFLDACGPPSLPKHTVVVNFITSPIFPGLESYVDQFEAAHPEIRINVTYQQHIPKEWPKHFDAALMSGSFSIYQPDLWLDLAPLSESDPLFDVDDFFPRALSTGYVEGRFVALPVGLSFNVLVYDPRQLIAADITLPSFGWSWEDFRNVVMTLEHHYNDGNGTVFAEDADQGTFLLGWMQAQAPLYENVESRFIPSLDRPESQSVLLDACDILSKLSTPPNTSMPANERLARLQAGQAAMTTFYGFSMNWYSRYQDLAVASLPHPSKDLQANAALAISRGTGHPQAAWQWIRFLSHQPLVTGNPELPARQSIAQSQRLWDTLDTKLVPVVRAILTDHTDSDAERYREPLWILEGELWDALFKTCKMGVPVDEALKDAQTRAKDKLVEWYEDQKVEPTPFSIVAHPTGDKTAKTLTLVALDPAEQLYIAAADAFKAFHPEWSVQLGDFSSEGMLKADCVSIRTPIYDKLTALGMQTNFLPLESIAELTPLLDEGSFFPQAIEAVSWQGQLSGIPIAIQPLVLYYNAEVFRELNFPLPTSEWTVADVLDAAEKITIAAPSRLGYAPREGAEVRFVLEQQGVSLFSVGPPLEPRFTSPDVLSAIERLLALQGGQEVVSQDLPAMMFSFYRRIPPESNWHTVALKPYPDTRWPITLVVSAVPRESTNVQMAWEWIAFLAQWEGARGDDVLPSVQALATNENTRLELGDERLTAYKTALERSTIQAGSEQALVKDIAATWFDLALKEVKSGELESVLGQAQAKAKQFIDCQTRVAVTLETIVTCVGQADPEHWLAKLGSEQ